MSSAYGSVSVPSSPHAFSSVEIEVDRSAPKSQHAPRYVLVLLGTALVAGALLVAMSTDSTATTPLSSSLPAATQMNTGTPATELSSRRRASYSGRRRSSYDSRRRSSYSGRRRSSYDSRRRSSYTWMTAQPTGQIAPATETYSSFSGRRRSSYSDLVKSRLLTRRRAYSPYTRMPVKPTGQIAPATEMAGRRRLPPSGGRRRLPPSGGRRRIPYTRMPVKPTGQIAPATEMASSRRRAPVSSRRRNVRRRRAPFASDVRRRASYQQPHQQSYQSGYSNSYYWLHGDGRISHECEEQVNWLNGRGGHDHGENYAWNGYTWNAPFPSNSCRSRYGHIYRYLDAAAQAYWRQEGWEDH